MICNDVSECFEQISAYFSGDCTGFFLLVDTEDHDTFQKVLQRLQADGSKKCVYVSEHCSRNGLPDVDSAVRAACVDGDAVLVGVSQARMLQSGEALDRSLDDLLSRPVSGHCVALLDHCRQVLQKYLHRDIRLKNRVVLVEENSSPLPKIRLVKSAELCVGAEPLNGIPGLLGYLEKMSCADLERQPVLNVLCGLNPGLFSRAAYYVSAADGIYETLCAKYSDVAGGTQKCNGTDEQWIFLAGELGRCGSLSAVVCAHFGAATNLSAHIRDVWDGGSSMEKWLLWLALSVFGERSNSYLTLVLRDCPYMEQFTERAYLCLAGVDVTHPDFRRMRSERRRLLSQLPEEIPLVTRFCDKVGVHEKNAVFYLSDGSDTERYEFLRCLSVYDYSPEELERAVDGFSKPLALYMREFAFDAANTKLAESDSGLRQELTAYFSEYKRQKLTNRIHGGFVEKVGEYASQRPYNKLKARSKIVSQMDRSGAQLFFFDALGVEYLAFIRAKCEEYGLLCEIEIGRCELPSITVKNKEFLQYFPENACHKIDALDEMKHHSTVYDYEKCRLPLHLFGELEVIDEELRRIRSMLVQDDAMKKAVIVSDHGASRLAVRYGHESPANIQLDEDGQHSGRCCPADSDPHIPFAAYEDGYAVLANYERFRGGRRANVEVHGGASLEEVLVPVVTLTRRPENVEFCFTEQVITLVPREVPQLTLYANVPMARPRLLIDGEFIDGELVADSRHAKFLLPKIKRRGEYLAEVYDGDVSRGVRLAFTAQKNTKEVDLFGFGGKK
jgi:hypothetical protein